MGATVGGQILDRVNCRLYMAVVLMFFGAMIIALPWAYDFLSLMALAAVMGLFQGALDCGKIILNLFYYQHVLTKSSHRFCERKMSKMLSAHELQLNSVFAIEFTKAVYCAC